MAIDAKLIPYRGSTPFSQYASSKSAKYSLKIFWIDGIIYVGQPKADVQRNLGFDSVKTLVSTIQNTGFNLTIDNIFTILELTNYLSVLLCESVNIFRQLRVNNVNNIENRYINFWI